MPRFISSCFALVSILASTSCQDVTGPEFDVESMLTVVDEEQIKLHLVGQANIFGLGENTDLVINALRTFKGTVSGQVIVPFNSFVNAGDVFELVAPSATYDHWCVSLELNEVPGFNVQVYVKDSGDGKTTFDEWVTGGDFGATCATYPAPFFDFEPVVKGDYNGSVKAK